MILNSNLQQHKNGAVVFPGGIQSEGRTKSRFPSNPTTNILLIPSPAAAPIHSMSASSSPSSSSCCALKTQLFFSSIGTPFAHSSLTQRHILALNVTACAVAISASWLFFSVIPTLRALKKSAESLEKLLDVAREELPDTMAAIRLSSMEISDLTVELTDLGQEINEGVRSSTRAVRIAEDRLRRLTSMTTTASVQEKALITAPQTMPEVAKTVQSIRHGIVSGRSLFRGLISLTKFSGWVMNYLASFRGRR